MLKKIVSILFMALLSFGLIEGFDHYYNKREESRLQNYFDRIASDTSERIESFGKSHYGIALTLVDALDNSNWTYGHHVKEIVDLNPEFLGINLINENGKIIKVYPEETNLKSLGKISQNFPRLKKHTLTARFWLSPVFDLFQEKKGIVLYLPIQNEVRRQKGWLALVIDAEEFFNKIKSAEFLKNSELLIRDAENGKLAFSSGIEPGLDQNVYSQRTVNFLDRQMIIKVWPKVGLMPEQLIPQWLKICIGIVLTLLGVYALKLSDQKKNAQSKLVDINLMLKLTTKDVINRFLDKEFTEEDKDQFISNLLEQIDLLQTMSQNEDTLEEKNIVVLDLINQQTELFHDVILKKKLKFIVNKESFKGIEFKGNEWLIQNCLITNVMLHLLKHSHENNEIRIEHEFRSNLHHFKFESKKPIIDEKYDPFVINRRLEIAKKITHLYQGQFLLSKVNEDQLNITLILPKSA